MKKFFGDWTSYESWKNDFVGWQQDDPVGLPTESEIVLASCVEESYEGSCVVYWVRDGKLYEHTGSHCSCNGYSDETDSLCSPKTPITSAYLTHRPPPFGLSGGSDIEVAWDALLELAAKLESVHIAAQGAA